MRSIAVIGDQLPLRHGTGNAAAIAVGLGRAAKNGILFRNARSPELFKNIRIVVFDKTGTLTKGNLSVSAYQALVMKDDEFRKIIFSLEKISNHPIAKSITAEWKTMDSISWKRSKRSKDCIRAEDNAGNTYQLVRTRSPQADQRCLVYRLPVEERSTGIGWFDMEDEIRGQKQKEVISYLHAKTSARYC